MMASAFRFLAFFALGAFSMQGCSPACDTGDDANDPVPHHGGTVVNGIYTSSSSHGPLLPFPGGKRYDLAHHLGFEPIQVQLYWSFSVEGIGVDAQTGKSSLTLATGNSALIQLKNEHFIRVKNDSCVDYALLVIASGDPRTPDGGAVEAGPMPFTVLP
jgi:hypothetical protein